MPVGLWPRLFSGLFLVTPFTVVLWILYDILMSWNPASVLAVTRVAMRKYKAALDGGVSDSIARARVVLSRLVGLSGPSYRDAVLATNPFGYWRLGEASGTVVHDEMGLHNGIYANGPTLGVPGLLTGDSNTAVTFDGVNQSLAIANGLPDAAPGGTTWAFWCRGGLDSDSQINIVISDGIGNWGGASVGNTLWPLSFSYGADGISGPLTMPVNDGTLHFCVLTISAGGEGFAYVDAVAGVHALGVAPQPGGTLYIARHVVDNIFEWPGTVCELATWGRVLSPVEIDVLNAVGKAAIAGWADWVAAGYPDIS